MRRVLAGLAVGAVAAIVPAVPAGATHTGGGCPHGVTLHAHQTVPHHNHGTHQAHMSIPYCPPHDAPRHMDAGTH
ncbi:MAG TPA: hypothetical protein VG455_05050 [Acidimicrobiales bacterium]|nr:hypothetical protein [Acidimicrobiales bacterium]